MSELYQSTGKHDAKPPRPNPRVLRLLIALALIVTPLLATAGDWPTYLHDNQHTAASPDETTLSTSNAGQLTKLWAFKTGGAIASSATVVSGTVYVGSWDGYEYALDATTGSLKWKTFLGTTSMPNCAPPAAGVTSSATVQNGVVYLGGGDSYWYALDATTGNVLWKVYTGDNSTTGGHYNWSSPLLYNGYAYIGIASFGDCPLVQGQLLQVSLSTHQVVNTFNVVPAGQVGGGIWSTPSVDPTTNTLYVTTGTTGASDETTQPQTQALLALDASTLALKSSWQIPPAQLTPDADWGTTLTLFSDKLGTNLVAGADKNGYVYAFDRSNITAGPQWQQQIAIGGYCPTCGDGSVSSAAFGNSQLYVAGGTTTINGVGYPGSVRAIDPATGTFIWQHGAPGIVLGALAYANGLVIDGAGATMEVLNAATGARLYSYTTGGSIYSPASVANGQIFEGSTDGNVYAFGLPSTPSPTPAPDPNCPSGWSCQDIGNPSPAGSETISGSTWSLTAGGAGISGTSDQFRLLSQSVSGDIQVSAQVVTQQGASLAGLMVRQSTDPGSPDYSVFITGGNTLAVQYRTGFGSGTIRPAQQSGTPPLYLEIQRTGDQFVAATSTDGVNYTLVPGSTVTVAMPPSVLAGLATSSGTNGTAATSSYSAVMVGAPTTPPATPTQTTPCPSGWTCADIGNPALVGSQSLSGGTWTVQGAGGDIWGTSDQFHYVWQSLSGDGSISAHVISQTNTDPWAKAGVMLRQSTDPGAAFYDAMVTPGNGITVQYRPKQGGSAVQAANITGMVPLYLRVARSGNTYMAYTSSNGSSWTAVVGSSVTITMTNPTLAGLAVTSHNPGTLGSATFDTVSVSTTVSPSPTLTNTPPPHTAVPTNTPVGPTATPTTTPTAINTPAPCPIGWTCADIGNPALVGSQSLSGGTWTVQGAGGDIWGTSDQFHYVWQSLSGDGSISAHVISQTNTDPWAKAGVMLRQSTDPGAAFYDAMVTPGNGITVQYRATQGASAVEAARPSGTVPVYLKVTRSGSTYTAYISRNGSSWKAVAGSSVTVSMSGTVLRGMAVTSHNFNALSTVTFSTVSMK